MNRRSLITFNLVMVQVMLFTWIVKAQGNISNPDFESDTDWAFFDNGEYWTGEYSSLWASHGERSYLIHIPSVPDVCDNYPGTNTYAEIYQDVDLTGVRKIIFDLRTMGMWDVPGLGPEYYNSAEVWIDGVKIYSRERQEGIFLDQELITSGFTGIHRLVFRMQGHADFCSTAIRRMFIDNLRVMGPQINYLPLVLSNN